MIIIDNVVKLPEAKPLAKPWVMAAGVVTRIKPTSEVNSTGI